LTILGVPDSRQAEFFMNEISLRKWHRRTGIVLAFYTHSGLYWPAFKLQRAFRQP